MRICSAGWAAIVVALVFPVPRDVVAQGQGQGQGQRREAERFPWYVTVGAGSNRTGVLEQAGFNRDDVCYPTNICPRTPDGYRWSYDLEPDSGSALGLAVGRSLNVFRIEVSASSVASGIRETFTGITYFDGTPVLPDPDSGFANTAETAVDGFSTRTLSLGVYRDFRTAVPGIVPYVGIGVGLSEVELSGLYFRSEYTCVRAPCAGRPAAEYNSFQDADLTDTVLSGQVHAGVDYPLAGNRYVLGLKLSYQAVGDMEARAGYLAHPIADETATTTISGIGQWSLTVGVKYRFGARPGT